MGESGIEGPALRHGLTVPAAAAREAAVSCSSSLIGRNSDNGGGAGSGDEEAEVQSSYKGPLDTMDALGDSLPFRNEISKFYCGKSKSFTSLASSSTMSAKDLAKPNNTHNKKRKNFPAFSDKKWSKEPMNTDGGGGTAKRAASMNRGTAPHVTGSSSGSNSSSSSSSEEEHEPSRCLPPHLQNRTSTTASPPCVADVHLRSYSMADLQGAVDALLL